MAPPFGDLPADRIAHAAHLARWHARPRGVSDVIGRPHRVHSCDGPECGLRFPAPEDFTTARSCPSCNGPLLVGAVYDPTPGTPIAGPPLRALTLALDNLRSAGNVGTIIRTADAAGVSTVVLGGISPTPEHPGVAKTALGAEANVAWRHEPDLTHPSALDPALPVWVLETGPASEPLHEAAEDAPEALVLIAGHEVVGVDPELRSRADRLVHLPMRGIKDSLNVAVAVGVATHVLLSNGPVPRFS